MKIRTGFVSNSSSSSFILALNRDVSKIEITISTDLNKLGDTITTKDALAERIRDEWLWEDGDLDAFLEKSPYHREMYDALSRAIDGGKKVIWGQVDNGSDSAVEQYLRAYGFPESSNYIIIKNLCF